MPVWLSYPPRSASVPAPSATTKHVLVYFVPGNPGLVDYYAPFLERLRQLLDDTSDRRRRDDGRDVRFHVLARNLVGFDDGDDGGGAYGPGPFDLATQVRAVLDCVVAQRIDLGPGGGARHGTPFDDVVLMGHSVGSYIALDVVRRLQSGATGPQHNTAPAGHVHVRLGVLLFATLTHLAASPRGRQLAALLATPVLGPHVHTVAQAALWVLPVWFKTWAVEGVLGFPPHAAAATLRFLNSTGGARQALFLGRDELRHIADDTWDDELWSVSASSDGESDGEKRFGKETPDKFVILFGADDHWVANDCRDRFIARRHAHAASATRIVVDERGWPHDFCIHYGEEVAETVGTWIADAAESF